MTKTVRSCRVPGRLAIALLLFLTAPVAGAGESDCEAADGFGFVCGPKNAEDLVLVPGTQWILASSMAPGGGIYLLDAERKTWEQVYPGPATAVQQDFEAYAECPGAPDPGSLVTHGLNLRSTSEGHSMLYVVGHGGREAIEVFAVDATAARPLLTWKGCVLTPEAMAANSVASLPDGSLLATIPLRSGIPIDAALAGEPTGGVYAWSPGDRGFTKVEGTDLPYANGIEVSEDGREFYVASSGLFNVTAFSNTTPARVLRRSESLGFLPDNLHMDAEGRLLTAGLQLNDPVCGNLEGATTFDFQAFMTCPRPFTVWAIEPGSMAGQALITGAANEHFSNITMALPVGNEIWIGTFSGDRVAYRERLRPNPEPGRR